MSSDRNVPSTSLRGIGHTHLGECYPACGNLVPDLVWDGASAQLSSAVPGTPVATQIQQGATWKSASSASVALKSSSRCADLAALNALLRAITSSITCAQGPKNCDAGGAQRQEQAIDQSSEQL